MNDNQRQFGWGLPILLSLALWIGLLLVGGAALAQSSVLPGYQVCSTASGSTQCSFQPLDSTHGLPISAVGVATCGSESLTAGTLYLPRINLTGTLCTVGASGTTTVQGNQTNGAAGAVSALNVPVMGYNYVSPDSGVTWAAAAGLVVGTAGVPSTQVVSVQGVISGTPVIIQGASTGGGFPTAATAISGNATGSTGAVVGTLAAASSKTTYICGFNVSAIGGVATIGPITIAGLIGSSQVYQVPVNAATGQILVTQNFNPCIPASTTNTAITTTTTADGTASAVDVNSWGYQQ